MLFRRLYNWIKYKTLPPSTLHKQRLMVERDTKHKKITSNFGLNFRNSKWSRYETYNIKPQHLIIYIKIVKNLILLLVIFLLVWYYNKYIIIYYIYNNLLYIYWICSDAFDHYVFSMMWLFSVVFYKLIGIFYSYFFFNNFSLKKKDSDLSKFSEILNDLNVSKKSPKNIFINKEELNWTLYSWITVENSYKSSKISKNLFDISMGNARNGKWNNLFSFFTKFFKMNFALNTDALEQTPLEKNNTKNLKKNEASSFSLNSDNWNSTKDFSNIFVEERLGLFSNYFIYKNPSFNLIKNWNISNINTEIIKFSYLIKNKIGSFYFYNFNYQKLNNVIYNFRELSNIDNLLKNQLTLSKWNRWLYKYSILHRKIFKNSHKLTLSKKLINSGLYDSKVFNKNIWASEHYNKYFDKNSISSLSNLYYNNFFKINENDWYLSNKITNDKNTEITTLRFFGHYENSYFFLLKRFYLFNTLPSNLIKTTNVFKNLPSIVTQDNIKYKDNIFFKYFIFSSLMSKSFFLNLNFIFFQNSKTNMYKKIISSHHLTNTNAFFSKDLYLLLNDNNFLSKENLNILLWLVSGLNKNNELTFFNYLNIPSSFPFFKKQIVFINSDELPDLNYYLVWSLTNFDDFYLNDLLLLVLYYNE